MRVNMDVLGDDILDLCLTTAGFDLAVLLAHVCKMWEQARLDQSAPDSEGLFSYLIDRSVR